MELPQLQLSLFMKKRLSYQRRRSSVGVRFVVNEQVIEYTGIESDNK
jgi:hypothetical protein